MTQPRFETTVHAVHGSPAPPLNSPCRGWLEALLPDGRLHVITANGLDCTCDWLDTGSVPNPPLAVGDALLLLPPGAGGCGVVLGRVGVYQPLPQLATLVLNATEALSLRCGDPSIDLRADGKVMICGDDVLVRAKGTNRIRAGTVSIN